MFSSRHASERSEHATHVRLVSHTFPHFDTELSSQLLPFYGRNERRTMKNINLMVVLLCLAAGTLMAQEPKVTSLMTKDLADVPGREALMITVEYPPGGADPVHRHNAHGFIYVLEGSVVMQVKGGKPVTLTPGQTFYEAREDVHVVGKNASSTKPAKMLVLLIKDKGAPPVIPVAK